MTSEPENSRSRALDFYELRREGIGHIEQAGSEQWTDYNTHDPGITILETLAFAITELTHRTGFPVVDILASADTNASIADPYPGQAFPTARRILTVNPTTVPDLRRALIDVDTVRNAWVQPSPCPCGSVIHAGCTHGTRSLAFEPDPEGRSRPFFPDGLYDVLLELETDPDLGDLNDHSVVQRRTVGAHGRVLTVELRLAPLPLDRSDELGLLIAADELVRVEVDGPFLSSVGTVPLDDNELRDHADDPLYIRLTIHLTGGEQVALPDATVRLIGSSAALDSLTVDTLVAWLEDTGANGFIATHRRKLAARNSAVAEARAVLNSRRNLAEDFCRVEIVETIDVAVCADVEVAPTADIELVQAQIWHEIERYLNPPPEFLTLDDLTRRGVPIEEIFNGPELNNGFLIDDELSRLELRSQLEVSQIIHRLMDIEGVVGVEHVLITGYDVHGFPLRGMADPDPVTAAFDREQSTARWRLFLPPRHRPRLNLRMSRFQFASEGLPFRPRRDEAEDTLVQLRGRDARPKLRGEDLDRPVPLGRRRELRDYRPVRHELPQTYGVGGAGLPSGASLERRAQAHQLKAYLAVYDQILANAQNQVAHTADLFSLDPKVANTYFVTDPRTVGVVSGTLTADDLAGLAETRATFLERRNRFLDHLLARFAESFGDYPMMLADVEGVMRAKSTLIGSKVAFLRALPRLGHDRGRAFDHTAGCRPDNAAGLKERVNLLLGLPDLGFGVVGDKEDPQLALLDMSGARHPVMLLGDPDASQRELVQRMTDTTAFDIIEQDGTWRVVLSGEADTHLGQSAGSFGTKPDAEDFVSRVALWASHSRAIVVEHLLLRPKFAGDALYPDCGDSAECPPDDPYSFQLTYVMPGWGGPFNTDVALRRFANRTIAEQAPAHLVVKICWVGNHESQFDRFEDAWCRWIDADAVVDWGEEQLLETVVVALGSGETDGVGRTQLCDCAAQILAQFGAHFRDWMDANVAAGNRWEDFTEFDAPDDVGCHALDIAPDVAEQISALLRQRYGRYAEASYRLGVLLDALSSLRNTYPTATLHDCDAGSDANPVRLDQTSLGSI